MTEKKRDKNEIMRRYCVFSVALFFISFGVSLVTRSLLGTSPISSIPFVMSLNTIVSMGTYIFLLNIALMIGQMLMLGWDGMKRCKAELLMQLPVSVLFGAFIDLNMALLSFWHPEAYALRVCSLTLGCLVMATGISLEVIADVAMVSGEYFVHIASQRFKKEFGTVKIMFDVSLVVLAVGCSWILAGQIDGIREGTLIAAILTGPFVKLVMPRLRFVERWEAPAHPGKPDGTRNPEVQPNHTVITIARQYGSGGHEIGDMIAKRLGIPFYDNAMMEMVVRESGLSEQTVRDLDQRLPHGLLYEMVTQDFTVPLESKLSAKDALFVAQSRVIRRVAAQGSCVIVGRCADHVLRDNPNCIHLYLHASPAYKEARAISDYGIGHDKAALHVAKVNAARSAHYAYYTGKKWEDMRNYHMVFDTSKVSADAICEAVTAMYRLRTGN